MSKINKNLAITYKRNEASKISNLEFYSTHSDSIETFLHRVLFRYIDKQTLIMEPACGLGNIAEVLYNNGYKVLCSDIVNRGYEKQIATYDFLTSNTAANCTAIITNPPFKQALKFIQHSIDVLPVGGLTIMYLRLSFLEGIKRYEFFQKNPIREVWLHSSRQGCSPTGEIDFKNNGAICYAWFIWEKGWEGKTSLNWLPPNNRRKNVKRKDTSAT